MSAQVMEKWSCALKIEKDLSSLLKDKAPRFDDVETLIEKLRLTCEGTIFLDFEFAQKESVERHLWDAHIKINGRYRKVVDHYRQGDKKKNVVERRKVEQRYVDFIKRSQFFYKGYIQRLASHFSGMKELRRIAHRLSLEALCVDERVKVSPEVEKLIDMSCHATLLKLGDLSRYRNNLRTKNRSWEPALGYYSLANDLDPNNGSAHNQMAVIALADGHHLDAVYHLYRAVAVNEPHPLAKGNLEIEFKKITAGWEKQRSQLKSDSLTTLVWWFVLLHARYYEGADFATREELEKEVLSRMALLLKEQQFGDTLEKFVLINIAAEYFAGEQVKGGNSNPAGIQAVRTFFFCLGFNVRVMCMLLQALEPELKESSSGEHLPSEESTSTQNHERVTPAMRRIIPALRQYCVWLVSQITVITAPIEDRRNADPYIKELWKSFADILTQIINVFPPQELKSVGYLLEEDESTEGFKPFWNPQYPQDCNPYFDHASHRIKSRVTDPGVERHLPAMEMQSRIRDIVLCGLVLQPQDQYPNVPVTVRDGAFIYIEEALPVAHVSESSQPFPQSLPQDQATQDISLPKAYQDSDISVPAPLQSVAAFESHTSLDHEMSYMVDNILDDADTTYGMGSSTADIMLRTSSNGQHHTRVRSIPKALPNLPGLGSETWTPKPDELKFSPIRQNHVLSSTYSPFSLGTPKQQMDGTYHAAQGPVYGPLSPRLVSLSSTSPINNYEEHGQNAFLTMTTDSWNSTSIDVNSPTNKNRYTTGAGLRTAAALANGNKSTFSTEMDMLEYKPSPIGSQRRKDTYNQTPPGGQGG
ncbi:TPR-like protein [Glarea lozoyensis ATCC 20868]|uniref:TPR-like protein n=1 Tax=Glarea lozoyensis (strain ATCC 20868 / MF5171) TaxID=1116229 RepID=S3D8L7_GLAL2|nr:TPR-like protein [Glarea lozoyensis ATCC 20868]EPE34090.1 TPR-like protein [Glarea lozoyensis ATCC 20868]